MLDALQELFPVWFLIAAGGMLLTAALIESWRKWVWPVIQGLVHLSDAMPVLMDIAKEFKPNDGNSLRDRVARIEILLDTLTQQIEHEIIDD